jgi:hypothetical protein
MGQAECSLCFCGPTDPPCGGGGSIDAGPFDGGSASVCKWDGLVYKAGETFPSTGGCDSCTCQGDGTILCAGNLQLCQYACPKPQTIDCMPQVPPMNYDVCDSAYRQWITANCTGVFFTD